MTSISFLNSHILDGEKFKIKKPVKIEQSRNIYLKIIHKPAITSSIKAQSSTVFAIGPK